MPTRLISEIPLEEVTREDLQSLIDEKIAENRSLEYKREVHLNTQGEKKEFLADVSSFANSNGGDLIIGIECDSRTKFPKSLYSVSQEGEDKDIQRLTNCIYNGIEPRLPVEIKAVYISETSRDEYAVIIRIKKGWDGPYRIKYRESHRFYTRSPNGKYLMDINELRTAFNLSETRTEKIRSFVQERISDIFSDNIQFPMGDSPKLCLHIIPISAFDVNSNYDLSLLENIRPASFPLGSNSYDPTYNIDGLLKYLKYPQNVYSSSYLQYFRNGIIETACTKISGIDGTEKLLYPGAIEKYILEGINGYKNDLETVGVNSPFIIFISLIDVKGYCLSIRSGWEDLNGNPELIRRVKIHKEIAQLPEIYIGDYSQDIKKALKPCFDVLANMVGLPRSESYDDTGNYTGRY
ncbi:hypothetical protein J2128_000359 [Methanomicrobium sp. W14]|uniref:AlbA family DNA-binding domain-containing protein n=1 Tax=Methanomicrobium sp. W14 TaxID=2817839 RepID=UPI001AE7C245|nr:ATP-binding protein [Methanomicrobium sp. W14]MBP2132438.1 hypothetical protein [Methanomicrobium sp. W14]